jgi:hypothetical protein
VRNLYCRVMHPVARTINVVGKKTIIRNSCTRYFIFVLITIVTCFGPYQLWKSLEDGHWYGPKHVAIVMRTKVKYLVQLLQMTVLFLTALTMHNVLKFECDILHSCLLQCYFFFQDFVSFHQEILFSPLTVACKKQYFFFILVPHIGSAISHIFTYLSFLFWGWCIFTCSSVYDFLSLLNYFWFFTVCARLCNI